MILRHTKGHIVQSITSWDALPGPIKSPAVNFWPNSHYLSYVDSQHVFSPFSLASNIHNHNLWSTIENRFRPMLILWHWKVHCIRRQDMGQVGGRSTIADHLKEFRLLGVLKNFHWTVHGICDCTLSRLILDLTWIGTPRRTIQDPMHNISLSWNLEQINNPVKLTQLFFFLHLLKCKCPQSASKNHLPMMQQAMSQMGRFEETIFAEKVLLLMVQFRGSSTLHSRRDASDDFVSRQSEAASWTNLKKTTASSEAGSFTQHEKLSQVLSCWQSMAWVQFAIQIPGQDFIDYHASNTLLHSIWHWT